MPKRCSKASIITCSIVKDDEDVRKGDRSRLVPLYSEPISGVLLAKEPPRVTERRTRPGHRRRVDPNSRMRLPRRYAILYGSMRHSPLIFS